jgi:hypothetical protein
MGPPQMRKEKTVAKTWHNSRNCGGFEIASKWRPSSTRLGQRICGGRVPSFAQPVGGGDSEDARLCGRVRFRLSLAICWSANTLQLSKQMIRTLR